MAMTAGEIARSYREAKDRASQIQILADLNQCEYEDIVEILTGAGEKVRIAPKSMRKSVNDATKDSAYRRKLFVRLDTLNRRIWPLEQEYLEIVEIIRSGSYKR